VNIVFLTFITSDYKWVLQYDILNFIMRVLFSLCLLAITLSIPINVLLCQINNHPCYNEI